MEGTEMLEDLLSEIAIEAVAPRKALKFSTSENKSIEAQPKSPSLTEWILRYNDQEKKFMSREGLDEVPTITIMLVDFFQQDWTC